MMRLVQFRDSEGRRAVAASRGDGHVRLDAVESVYELALETIESTRSLADIVATYATNEIVVLGELEAQGRLLAPIEHPVPTRCWITESSGPAPEGEADDATEVSTRWNFRGNGSTLVAAGQPLNNPAFARGAAPCPAIAGLFVVAEDGTPCRVGWALGHALTDPALRDGPGVGHASLRPSALGPELLLGPLPPTIVGEAGILRAGVVAATRPLSLGDDAMTRSFDELTRGHFRYATHRRPGDVHIHFFGTGQAPPPQIAAQPADVFDLSVPAFGWRLRNQLLVTTTLTPSVRVL